jgi:ABC-type amino acid transport system permease subunit
MKKTSIARIVMIALWPVIFLILYGHIATITRLMVSRNFNPRYYLILITYCVISGLVFAINRFSEHEFLKQKIIVRVYLISGISVLLLYVLWIMYITQVVRIESGFINNIFISIPSEALSLMLGYTWYSAIKALLICKRCK